MSAQVYEDPVMLDSTGLAMVTKLEAIKNAVQPVNAGTDIDLLIPSSGWTSSSPYQYTYTNSHITSGCMVKVNFLEGNNYTTPLYLNFEKITNGIIFTAPTKPTNNISVRVHIFSADTTSTTATNAEAVSTSAISGANNVEDALGSLSNQMSNLMIRVEGTEQNLTGMSSGEKRRVTGFTLTVPTGYKMVSVTAYISDAYINGTPVNVIPMSTGTITYAILFENFYTGTTGDFTAKLIASCVKE